MVAILNWDGALRGKKMSSYPSELPGMPRTVLYILYLHTEIPENRTQTTTLVGRLGAAVG